MVNMCYNKRRVTAIQRKYFAVYGNFVLSAFSRRPPAERIVSLPRLGPSLHAMPTAAGFTRGRDPRYDWHGLKRGRDPFALFQYTLAGCGRLEFEGQPYDVPPGSAMILYFPHDNRYWLPKGGAWDFFYLCLNGSEIIKAWRTAIHESGPVLAFRKSSPILRTAAGMCRQILDTGFRSPWHASAQAYDLAMKLLEEFGPKQTRGKSPHDRPEPIKKAIEFCRAHLASPIGVDDLAAAAGYSRYHFTRLFQAGEGIGPGVFICRQRLLRAVELMKLSGDSVKGVAQKCGFKSSGYFCKAFRKAYGVSPGEFRTGGMY